MCSIVSRKSEKIEIKKLEKVKKLSTQTRICTLISLKRRRTLIEINPPLKIRNEVSLGHFSTEVNT